MPENMTLEEYGTWDLHHIKMADIVFGYMEKTNPSGIGMAVELGYAAGLGKTVILCLEEGNEHIKDRYIAFMRKAANVTYSDFDVALKYLRDLCSRGISSVYLAGGMRSGWQDRVITLLDYVTGGTAHSAVFDPRNKGI